MNDYEWEPISFRLKVGLDYLGQIYQTYTPDGRTVWRAVLTFFPASGHFVDVLGVTVPTSDEAKFAVDGALDKHRAAAAAGGVS